MSFLPDCMTQVEIVPGYPVLEVQHPAATARIALHGAHVMDWIPAGEKPVLYMSPAAAIELGKPIRGGVPIVPVGITGVGWLRFGGTVRVRVGDPIPAVGRPTKTAVTEMTAATRRALLDLVADGRDREPPGRFGRWLTEAFQDWPEGSRPPVQEPE